jgi:hypothetical protein
VQKRGAAVIEARGLSSAASAANAAIGHVHDWLLRSHHNDWVSMSVPSDGSYGIPEGVMYSFPVTCRNGHYSIVQGLPISELGQKHCGPEELLEGAACEHAGLVASNADLALITPAPALRRFCGIILAAATLHGTATIAASPATNGLTPSSLRAITQRWNGALSRCRFNGRIKTPVRQRPVAEVAEETGRGSSNLLLGLGGKPVV